MKALLPRCRWNSAPVCGALIVLSACSSNGSKSGGSTSGTNDAVTSSGTGLSGAPSATNTAGAVDGPSSTSSTSGGSDATSAAAVSNTSAAQASSGGSGGTASTVGPTTGAAGDGGTSSAVDGGTTSTVSTTGGGEAVPSAGCSAPTAPSSGSFSIDVDGTEREYILRLPEGHDPTRPYPLILAWHGAQYSAEWVDTGGEPQSGPYFGVQAEAGGNAIFVAPQALTGSWTNQGGRDLAFADAMVERFEAELCLDESRLFSIGFSMGAIMTIRIGCARADRFRAIVPLSGSLPDDCAASDLPIAYFSAHGDVDQTITDDQGMVARDEFARRNGCSEDTADLERERCIAFQGCDSGYPVEWCSFSGEHVPAPFAGEAIWQFLSQF
ncbi:MAG TPA: Ricin and poly(3-hydroxybutyrate) depolymerase fusion [Polyangiaceae bacterium]